MTSELAAITIGIDPSVEFGPLTLAWHGIMIAVGIAAGAVLATRYAGERGLDRERVVNAVLIIALAGVLGARLYYLLENDPGALLRPWDWVGNRGFSFYGAMIFGSLAVALYLRRASVGARYLDALAAGFPLGMAVGRVGDLINGEHYGRATDVAWGVRHTHPDADVPSATVAYHDGGLYEIVLALAMFALLWPLRERFQRPLTMLWTVVALYSLGRFFMFFYRSDSDELAGGLNGSQWTSVALIALAGLGWVGYSRRAGGPGTT